MEMDDKQTSGDLTQVPIEVCRVARAAERSPKLVGGELDLAIKAMWQWAEDYVL